jgi:lactate racemase
VQCAVVEADLRIALGMITPHMDAGFSGGAKMILPGVCGARTVEAFHARSADDFGSPQGNRDNPLGHPQPPLRLALEAFVQERIPLHFILNLVLNREHEVFQCVAGDAILAHRRGVDFAMQAYSAPVRRRYPLVVANCAPYQQDLWQSCKGLWCGDLLCEEGGTLIWATQAPQGWQGYPHLPEYIGCQPEELKARLDAGKAASPGEAATGVMIGRMKARKRIILASPSLATPGLAKPSSATSGLNSSDARRMGLEYYNSVTEAVLCAVQRLPEPARFGCLAIIPQAGVTLPRLPDG